MARPSSPAAPAHARMAHTSSGRPVEPTAGVLPTQPAVALRNDEGCGITRARRKLKRGGCSINGSMVP